MQERDVLMMEAVPMRSQPHPATHGKPSASLDFGPFHATDATYEASLHVPRHTPRRRRRKPLRGRRRGTTGVNSSQRAEALPKDLAGW